MKQHILLIEDNEQNRYLVRFLLEAQGYTVVCAMDGPSGVTLAKESDADLILLDIQLPGMDGYAVAGALRQDPKLADVPIVAVTSYAMPGDRERCMEAGFTGYIEKPIDPEKFVAQVEEFLEPGL